MKSNQYIEDSYQFFEEASSQITEDMKNKHIIQSIINYSFGIERLLKGLLYAINPLYILNTPEFNNSIHVLYSNHIIPDKDNTKNIKKSTSSDVLTFRTSLLRASIISRATLHNKNKLFALSKARDVIAHHELKNLDYEKLRLMLYRDYYFILMDYIDDLKLNKKKIFGPNEDRILVISKKHQTDIKNIVRIKLEEHRAKWEKIKNNNNKVSEVTKVTNEILENKNRYEISCPSCNQRAILFTEPELIYEPATEGSKNIGEFITGIRCGYCDLDIKDSNELDYLGYGKILYHSYDDFDDDIPF